MAHPQCQSRGWLKNTTRINCGHARCSVECYRTWSRREYYIWERLFTRVPQEWVRLFGNVSMAADTPPNEWRKAIRTLKKQLSEWEQATGETLRVGLYAHAQIHNGTGKHRLHYDVIGFSSVSLGKAEKVIKKAWKGECGGTYCSVEPMRQQEAALRYATKFLKFSYRKCPFRLLETSNGYWQSAGLTEVCRRFGLTPESLWKEQTAIWKVSGKLKQPTMEDTLRNGTIIECVKQVVRTVLDSNPTKNELRKVSGLNPITWDHVINELEHKAGLRSYDDGRLWFNSTDFGIELPPTEANGRFAWQLVKGKSAAETLGKFIYSARKAIGATQGDGVVSYHWYSSTNDRKQLAPSTYIEPPDTPPILGRQRANE
jgi:hypothetical protein